MRSFEDDDSLAKDFERFAGPSRYKKASDHLDLVWNVAKSRQPEACGCCSGSGVRECKFCRGTGAMMLGDMYFCSLALGCKQCPVCRAKGQVACSHCKGTGFRAGWMEPGCPL
ncbi:hypothetical protein WJX72_010913 [[Myrmecia] bisecta]|uniref:Uncharacterized protein n=1 Tax=[Myrmecia] bisecta TaxID=41462 RepID=A0AAW1PL74_9CHLO